MKLFLTNVEPFYSKNYFDAVLSRMPAWRQEKVMSLLQEKDRNLSLGASLSLEYGLCAQNIALSESKVLCNSYGKPYLLHYPNVHFSISHSGIIAGTAFSDTSVGFDIEKIEYDMDTISLEDIVLHPSEKAFLQRKNELSPEKRVQFFYSIWTLKECYLKALGCGLSIEPNSIALPTSALENLGEHDTWTLFSYNKWALGSFLLQYEKTQYALAFCKDTKRQTLPCMTWIG